MILELFLTHIIYPNLQVNLNILIELIIVLYETLGFISYPDKGFYYLLSFSRYRLSVKCGLTYTFTTIHCIRDFVGRCGGLTTDLKYQQFLVNNSVDTWYYCSFLMKTSSILGTCCLLWLVYLNIFPIISCIFLYILFLIYKKRFVPTRIFLYFLYSILNIYLCILHGNNFHS